MNLQRELDSIKNKINNLSDQLDKTNSALTGLNILNILALQKSVNEIGDHLDRMKKFNYRMDSLNDSVLNFNKLIEPINKLASEKLAYSELEAKTKNKEFTLRLAQIKAKEENISEWNAYKKLENAEEYSQGGIFVVGVLAGMCVLPVITSLSKL